MDDSLDALGDSGSSSESSVTVSDPSSVPDFAPADPAPEPSPEPSPVGSVSPSPVGPTPSDPAEGVVLPGEDPAVEDTESDQDVSAEGVVPPGEDPAVEDVEGDQDVSAPVNAAVDLESPVSAGPELVGIETYALSPVESSTGLKGILLEVLGPYDNVVTQYKYQQGSNSYYTYVNEVTPDYPWIASAALFIVLLVSLFGLLKRSMSWMR